MSLPGLTSVAGANFVGITANGGGSAIDLPNLTTFTDAYDGSIGVTDGAILNLNSGLTDVDHISITVDSTGGVPLDQFSSLNDDTLTIEGGTYDLPNLTNIDNTSVDVEGGGSLTLPGVTGYTSDNGIGNDLEVIDTTAGGTLALPGLLTITGQDRINVWAAGPDSRIDLPLLTSFSSTRSFYSAASSLSVTQGATVNDGDLTTLHGVVVTLDGTGMLAVSQLTSLTDGELQITGGHYAPTSAGYTPANSFTNLSNINGTGIYVTGGSLSLPAVIHYDLQGRNIDFSVSGATGTLTLANLTTIDASSSGSGGSGSYSGAGLNFKASAGGKFVAASLISIDDSSSEPIGAGDRWRQPCRSAERRVVRNVRRNTLGRPGSYNRAGPEPYQHRKHSDHHRCREQHLAWPTYLANL